MAANTAPTFNSSIDPISIPERFTYLLDTNATIFDSELSAAGHYAGASITLRRSTGATAQDRFGLSGTQFPVEGGALVIGTEHIGTVAKNSGGILALTFNENATQTLVDQALRSITYTNLSNQPPSSVELTWSFSDGNTGTQGTGGELIGTATQLLTITTVADDMQFLVGDGASNSLSGGTGDDVMDGAGGDDSLIGGLGDDMLYGGDGRDALQGGGGSDELFGEDGNDYLIGGVGADALDGGLGWDTVSYKASNTGVTVDLIYGGKFGDAAGDSFVSIEQVEGSYGDDRISGDAGANTFFATLGNDRYDGRDGPDVYSFSLYNWTVQIAFGGAAKTLALSIGVVLSDTSYGIAVKSGGGPSAEHWIPTTQYDLLLDVEGLKGGNSNDSIIGNAVDNIVFVSGGSDTLSGGGGFDYLATLSNDRVDLQAGTVRNAGGWSASISDFEAVAGSSGNETIIGDGRANRLQGESGNDSLSGMGGADHLLGGSGVDLLLGGAADDLLDGGLGADLMDGGDGIDTVSYLDGEVAVSIDLLKGKGGGAGNSESAGDRYVRIENVAGSEHDDYIRGSNSDNILAGDRGSDEILGCSGNDLIYGDVNPRFVGELPEAAYLAALNGEEVDCGCDDDETDPSTLVTLMDNIDGGDGNDIIYGQSGTDLLKGNCGDDRLYGGAQLDLLFGGKGDDILEGGGSFDFLFGGAGFDIASYSSSAEAVNVDLANPWSATGGDAAGDLIDELLSQVLSTSNLGSTFYSTGFTGLIGTMNATLDASPLKSLFAIPDVVFEIEGLRGSAFDDTLKGDVKANSLDGAEGDDILAGGDGNDTVIGGAGNDVMNGNLGSDTASYQGATAAVAVNLSVVAAQNTQGGGFDTLIDIENLVGSAHADTLTGNAGLNTLDGGAKNDILSGGEGNDILIGGGGNDLLNGGLGADTASYAGANSAVTVNLGVGAAQNTGGAGLDTLIEIENVRGSDHADRLTGDGQANVLSGGDGNDILNGRDGNDLMIGGLGEDIFVFDSAPGLSNVDVIRGFDTASDLIWLQNAIFTGLPITGTLSAAAFNVGAAATQADDRIIYNNTNGQLLYDADGVGGVTAVHFATLTEIKGNITNMDFLLV